jgi:glycosyltransferase involved in cell wall biosynthesis
VIVPIRITATIITNNEEQTLPACLETLSWADEVLLVDSGSTDGTMAIAAEFGARVHQQEWRGYAAQKNAAASLASNDWIFNIDADERVGAGLAAELETLGPTGHTPYSVVRISDFLGAPHRPVHKPAVERLVRLYDRRHASFGATAVHEKVMSEDKPVRLSGTLYHEGFRGLDDYVGRLNRISSLAAGERPGASVARLVGKPFARLLWDLFRHRLVLDGRRGFILAFMWAHHDLMVEAKRYERVLSGTGSAFDPGLFAGASYLPGESTAE